MGVDFYATAVLGCAVDASRLVVSRKARVCEHPLLRDDAAFCSVCGAAAYRNQNEPIDGYDQDARTLFGFDVVKGHANFVIVAAAKVRSDSHRIDAEPRKARLPFETFVATIANLREALRAHGLWDAARCGMWTVPEVG